MVQVYTSKAAFHCHFSDILFGNFRSILTSFSRASNDVDIGVAGLIGDSYARRFAMKRSRSILISGLALVVAFMTCGMGWVPPQSGTLILRNLAQSTAYQSRDPDAPYQPTDLDAARRLKLGVEIMRLRNRREWKREDLQTNVQNFASKFDEFDSIHNQLQRPLWLRRIEEGTAVKVSLREIKMLAEVLACTEDETIHLLWLAGDSSLADDNGKIDDFGRRLYRIRKALNRANEDKKSRVSVLLREVEIALGQERSDSAARSELDVHGPAAEYVLSPSPTKVDTEPSMQVEDVSESNASPPVDMPDVSAATALDESLVAASELPDEPAPVVDVINPNADIPRSLPINLPPPPYGLPGLVTRGVKVIR
jgi:hypothetical protein